jgi:hypothetical protein
MSDGELQFIAGGRRLRGGGCRVLAHLRGTVKRLRSNMHHVVRLLLAAACVAYAPASLAQSPMIAMRKASFDLTTSYLQVWSTAQAASPAYVARIYAPRIRFYGRMVDRNGLVQEKRRFVRRWPVRHYALRPEPCGSPVTSVPGSALWRPSLTGEPRTQPSVARLEGRPASSSASTFLPISRPLCTRADAFSPAAR